MITKKAFSIIEIIISTSILTLTVFGIYRLIGENTKIVADSNNYLNQNIILENTRECLKGQNFIEKKFLDFGNDLKNCNFGSNENFFKIDGIDYLISIETLENNWKISVESSTTGVLEKFFEK